MANRTWGGKIRKNIPFLAKNGLISPKCVEFCWNFEKFWLSFEKIVENFWKKTWKNVVKLVKNIWEIFKIYRKMFDKLLEKFLQNIWKLFKYSENF